MPYIIKCVNTHKGRLYSDYFKKQVWGCVNEMTFNEGEAAEYITKGGAKLAVKKFFPYKTNVEIIKL